MSLPRTRVAVLIFAVASASIAQSGDVPLANWTVPPYRVAGASGGYSTMADISPGVGFVAVQPCRIADTRGGGVFTGTYGPPAMAANAQRSFDINSAAHCPGIPAGVDAYSLNFTATQTAGAPGDVRAWPTGNPPVQITSVLNWTVGGATVANATIIPAGTNGFIDVYVAGTATHLLIDVNGYFTDQNNPGVSFHAVSATVEPAILGENTSTDANAIAIKGVINSEGYAVFGAALGTSGASRGVTGVTNSMTDGAIGVQGVATGSTGKTYGVLGTTASSAADAAGVQGVATSNAGTQTFGVRGISMGQTGGFSAGVTGEGFYTGVFGRGGDGVVGHGPNHGVFGVSTEGDGVGVRGINLLGGVGVAGNGDPYGVFSNGDFGGTGAKYFVEPHPEKADMVIRYVSLEGNESGTYFRGRSRFQNGLATIDVPEDFRLVTDRENLSIQMTPIGEMATLAVKSIGLDRIVVRGSRNVEFFYTVNGVRKTHKHLTPIGPGREYIPERPDAKMPLYLTEGQKEMLISNGTYRRDGTVNMETARRLGWDKKWEKRATPAPQPPSE